MKSITTSAIATVKGEILLREWKTQIEAQQSSGLASLEQFTFNSGFSFIM